MEEAPAWRNLISEGLDFVVGFLCVNHSNRSHVDDFSNVIAPLQHVYRLFHPHQDRTDRFRTA